MFKVEPEADYPEAGARLAWEWMSSRGLLEASFDRAAQFMHRR